MSLSWSIFEKFYEGNPRIAIKWKVGCKTHIGYCIHCFVCRLSYQIKPQNCGRKLNYNFEDLNLLFFNSPHEMGMLVLVLYSMPNATKNCLSFLSFHIYRKMLFYQSPHNSSYCNHIGAH